MEHLVLLWLTSKGPEIHVTVADCAVASLWYEAAVAWARRSGVPTYEVGYLCDYEPRVKR